MKLLIDSLFTGGRMRRITKISITIIILAAIYLVLPWLFGLGAHRYADRFLSNNNKTLGRVLGVHLDLSDYHRGWFHSTALLTVEQQLASGQYQTIKTLPILITHGPTFRDGGRVMSGLGMITVPKTPIGNGLPYEIEIKEDIGFQGEHGTLVLFTNKNDTEVSNVLVHQLSVHMSSNLHADQFIFRVNAKKLGFHDPMKNVSVDLDNFDAMLTANYLKDRHWKMSLGVCSGDNQFRMGLSQTNPADAVVINAGEIDLIGLQFDTQKLATLLTELLELKHAAQINQPVKPTAWMALFQTFLTDVIDGQTWMAVKGLSILTPMGELVAHYNVSFPTLPAQHDYFDIATRNVSSLEVAVPDWKYTDSAQTQFALNDFHYNEYNNTVFSRKSNMSFGELSVTYPTPSVVVSGPAPGITATGFTYQGEMFGDIRNLSQTMQWHLNQFCFAGSCFSQIDGGLQLLKMNYDAFRHIADATRRVVQFDPTQSASSLASRWDGLFSAYSKLISSESEIVLTHNMTTPDGKVVLHGDMSWPKLDLSGVTSPTINTYLSQSNYELHLLFPAVYLDTFLAKQHELLDRMQAEKMSSTQVAKVEPPFELQLAQFLQYALKEGYLKKVGTEYVMDLTGQGGVMTINGAAWKMP